MIEQELPQAMMKKRSKNDVSKRGYLPFYRTLSFKPGLCVGGLTLVFILIFAYFAITAQRTELMGNTLDEALRFSETLTNSMKHSMWNHDVEGVDSIVQTVGRQKGISIVRIFNHAGEVRFSTHARELGHSVDKKAEVCYACHSETQPFHEVSTSKRARVYRSLEGEYILGMVTPIYNERACFSAACHVHSEEQRVLGIVDVGVSLEKTDLTIAKAVRKTSYFALSLFLGITILLGVALVTFVGKPLRRMVEGTHRISRGEYGQRLEATSRDELGEIADSFNLMSERIQEREEELGHRREEYKILFENVPTYVAVVDREYRIVQANRNFKNTFGDQVGERCFKAYKNLEDKCKDCPVERTFREGKPQLSEERGRTKRGEEIHYLVYTAPIVDAQGDVLCAIEMSVDLTERKQLEEELRVSREFLDNLVENSIHGIVAADASGRIIIFNRSAERILGYQTAEVVRSRDLDRFFPRDFARRIHSALEGRVREEDLKTVAEETWMSSKANKRIPMRFSGVILTEEDSTIGAVGFIQDLRPLKALEREKRHAERLAVVGQTVTALAHGIKNIITGLEGGIYVIQTAMKRQDDSLLQKGWGMVERNIEKIAHLVKDLLSYSKVTVTELEQVKPNELAEEVCNLFKDKARQSGIELALDLDPEMDEANLDPKAVHTCLTNLMSNAIDACIDDEEKIHHRVVMRTRKGEDDSVTFEVEDNGTGIDEDLRERLFTNFFTTKGTKGTGLGLMVTHKLVHEHGGRIDVETEPGQGARFRITIPQEETALPPEEVFSGT